MDPYPPFFFHTSLSSRQQIEDHDQGISGHRADDYLSSYSTSSSHLSQPKPPHLDIFVPPQTPLHLAEAPVSPYSSASSGSPSNNSPLAESPLDIAPSNMPENAGHSYPAFPQGDAPRWRSTTSPMSITNTFPHGSPELYSNAHSHLMTSTPRSVGYTMNAHRPASLNSQSHQYAHSWRGQEERYRSFTQVGRMALSSDSVAGSSVGSYPRSREIPEDVSTGDNRADRYDHHVAGVWTNSREQSRRSSGPYVAGTRHEATVQKLSHSPHSIRMTAETAQAPSEPEILSLRSTHHRSSSDNNAYRPFGRIPLLESQQATRESNIQMDIHHAPAQHSTLLSHPVPTHRPRPVYAFSGSGSLDSHPSIRPDIGLIGSPRGHGLSQTGSMLTGTASGVLFPKQVVADDLRTRMESASMHGMDAPSSMMKEEDVGDDTHTAARLGHPSTSNFRDNENAEGEDSGGDDDSHVWSDMQDDGAGDFEPHSDYFHAASSLHPGFQPSMPQRHEFYASFSSDGSFSDSHGLSPSVSPTSSTSSPTAMKPRRHIASLPGPAPVPGLTKKSRGRRVPTIELSGSGHEVYEGSGKNPRSYACDAAGCGKIFARGEHLKRHVRSIHTYEKPHRCPFPGCGKDFSRHDNLRQHLRVHKGFEPVKNIFQSDGGSMR